MKNVGIEFQLLEEGEKPPIRSKWVPYHMVFDVKFDLTWKARWVAGGHRNDPPKNLAYSTVVSRESLWLGFLIVALNNLDALSADIGNVYINAKPRKQVHTTVGEEFGVKNAGRIAIIMRTIYGLKRSGVAWCEHFSLTVKDKLKYVPTKANQDVYIRPEVAPDGREYRLKGNMEAPK
eukprot:5397430-Ditylum_brightwellii.AAC.1